LGQAAGVSPSAALTIITGLTLFAAVVARARDGWQTGSAAARCCGRVPSRPSS
jgi:hypothetical protein